MSQRTLGRAWRRGYSTRSGREDRALASSSGPSLVATQKGPGDETNLARIVPEIEGPYLERVVDCLT